MPAVIAHRLAAADPIPNHPRWPLLIYPGAVTLSGDDPAALFEALFTRHGWPAAWRNGIHPFHHYHSNAHEVLGIYSGEATVRFGGEEGITVVAAPGDVIVLPAGTGHRRLAVRGTLGVVGAYPRGADPDSCVPPFARAKKNAETVLGVPLPAEDPVYGAGGPLFQHWI